MARNHNWHQNTCLKCGLMREQKTKKILMCIQPDTYKYEQYYEYNDGINKFNKRPDCKPVTKKCDLCGNDFKGEQHRVVDENFNVQKGLIQCGECYKTGR